MPLFKCIIYLILSADAHLPDDANYLYADVIYLLMLIMAISIMATTTSNGQHLFS